LKVTYFTDWKYMNQASLEAWQHWGHIVLSLVKKKNLKILDFKQIISLKCFI